MKRLVLYSDQIPGKSDMVDTGLLQMIDKPNPRIAYIPSRADLTRTYYDQKRAYYHRLKIRDMLYFDIDREYDPAAVPALMACDAVHLSGGDTAYFLASIKKRGFDVILNQYVQNGGILIGVSAGSILMSKCIDIVTVLYNEKNKLTETNSLGLCDFEFAPYWERNGAYLNALTRYSIVRKATIYACSDSDGILINDHEITFIGKVIQIQNGTVRQM